MSKDSVLTASSTPRERREMLEMQFLAPAARFSANATRQVSEEPCSVRTAYQRDRDRVVHSKSFRRLMHKTQVFIAPAGDHYRTRLTHTLEVAQIARTTGRALALNEDLIEAIAMGHDLGHTPFGHAGETALQLFLPGFRHNEQSLRVVDVLERDGAGLNLTDDVRDGILHHSKPEAELTGAVTGRAQSLEGEVVRVSDAIAYINHDLDDAIRARIVDPESIPGQVIDVLGPTHGRRINTLVTNVVKASRVDEPPGSIKMESDVLDAANALRTFLFERVYRPLNETENTRRAQRVVEMLCTHYAGKFGDIPEEYRRRETFDSRPRIVADYVASMTDRFAVDTFQRLYVPRYWSLPS